ncbi:MAG: MMPL family transporter, partial [Actinobacteria bacterium]|nr:MMPL family transporter [Actinomycetota bacterium]
MSKLAQLITARSKQIIVLWLLLLIATSLLSMREGANFTDSLSLPKSESQVASDLLKSEHSPDGLGSLQVVYASKDNSPLKPKDLKRIISAIKKLPFVDSISSPFAPGSQSMSADGKIAFSTINMRDLTLSTKGEKIQKIIDRANAKNHSKVQIEFMGANNQSGGDSGSHTSEIIAVLVSLLILLITFGSLTAALIPIIVAVSALLIASNLISLTSNLFSIATFAPVLSTLISLGVGIDYALFIVSRFRQSLRESHSVEESIMISLKTSGRAVIFAGLIVCLSILGLFLVGIDFLHGVAIATSISVLVTMCAAVTLLPALLMHVGVHINRFSIPKRTNKLKIAKKDDSKWQRWAGLIQRHPVKWATASSILLILFFIPATTMHLGTADAGNNPANSTSRKAYDLMSKGFGDGFAGPLILVASIPAGADTGVLSRLYEKLVQDADIAQVAP